MSPGSAATGPGVAADDAALHAAIVSSWGEAWTESLPRLDGATRERLAADYRARITALQATLGANGGVARPLHRKGVFAADAVFRVRPDLHVALRHGVLAGPGAAYGARVRFSNAAGRARPDGAADLRGIAVSIVEGVRRQDLLATNYPTSHARDTADFRAAANLARGAAGLPALLARVPPCRALKMIRTLRSALAPSASLADETYWSRSCFQLGSLLVEYRLAPAHSRGGAPAGSGAHGLTEELVARVRAAPLSFALELRGWTDDQRTPTHDGRIGWQGAWTVAAWLEIPARPELDDTTAAQQLATADAAGVSIANRWDADPRALRGRGPLNEFREEVYAASQAARR